MELAERDINVDDELEKDNKSDEDRREELEREALDLLEQYYKGNESIRKEVQEKFNALRKIELDVDLGITEKQYKRTIDDAKIQLDDLNKKYKDFRDFKNALNKKAGAAKADELIRRYEAKVRETALKEAESASINERNAISEKGCLFTRNKFWSWVIPVLVGAFGSSVAGVFIAKAMAPGEAPQSEDEKIMALIEEVIGKKTWQLVKDQVDLWKNKTSAQLWTEMAGLMDKWELALNAQLLFMSYIKQLTVTDADNLNDKNWPTEVEELELVNNLVAEYKTSKKSSSIYRKISVAKLTRKNANNVDTQIDLPKWQAADICELSLTVMIKMVKEQLAATV